MSALTKQAILSALQADSTLAGLLSVDPNDGARPAIFNARMNDLKPVYDSITFREASGKPFIEFNAAYPGESVNTVVTELIDFEVWTKKASVSAIEEILARLDLVLNQQALSLGSAGRVFWSERVITSPDNWDDVLLARFGLFRYRLMVEYT